MPNCGKNRPSTRLLRKFSRIGAVLGAAILIWYSTSCSGSSSTLDSGDNQNQLAPEELAIQESNEALSLVGNSVVDDFLDVLELDVSNQVLAGGDLFERDLVGQAVGPGEACVDVEKTFEEDHFCDGGGERHVVVTLNCDKMGDVCEFVVAVSVEYVDCILDDKKISGNLSGVAVVTVSNCGDSGDSTVAIDMEIEGVDITVSDEDGVSEIFKIGLVGTDDCGEINRCEFGDFYGVVSFNQLACVSSSENPVIECLPDGDRDGVDDSSDNCPDFRNPSQTDVNEDGVGDLCEPFDDGEEEEEEELPEGVIDLSKIYGGSKAILSPSITYFCNSNEDCFPPVEKCVEFKEGEANPFPDFSGFCRSGDLLPAICGDFLLDTDREECEPDTPVTNVSDIGRCDDGYFCDRRTCQCVAGKEPNLNDVGNFDECEAGQAITCDGLEYIFGKDQVSCAQLGYGGDCSNPETVCCDLDICYETFDTPLPSCRGIEEMTGRFCTTIFGPTSTCEDDGTPGIPEGGCCVRGEGPPKPI